MPEVSLFIYPWDFLHEEVSSVIDHVASLGVTRLEIATAYHSAELISPRRTHDVVTTAEANSCHLPLAPSSFSDVATPPSAIANEHPDLYERVVESAQQSGVAVSAWAIAFHNTTLATSRPDLAIENCFGDHFTHGLCPANPAARRYALELLAGVASRGLFDRILVESLSYLLYSHGHPHELWGVRMDPVTRYLLSLCFCRHCVVSGEDRGIDVTRLRATVRNQLTRSWNMAFPAGRDEDDGAELASLHQVWPELAAYTAMRMDIVTSLTSEAARAVAAQGTKLDVSAAVWGRPAFTNWIEGVDIAKTMQVADGFVLESYFPTAAEVAREIDHTQAIASLTADASAELAVALTLWPNHSPTLNDFLSKVSTVRDAGASRLSLYNYGTASSPTLEWVSEAVAEMARTRP